MKKKINKKIGIIGIPLLSALLIVVLLFNLLNKKEHKYVYRETQVIKGNLTVGISEDGNVSVGAADQTFDLDISDFIASGSSSSTSQSLWGNGNMNAMSFQTMMFQVADERSLEIEEVYVSVGQQVEEGVPLLKLTAESVEDIRGELATDVKDALLTLEQLKMTQKSSRLGAQQNYEINTTYGKIAKQEYDEKIEELEAAVKDAEAALTKAQNDKQNLITEREEIAAEFSKAKKTYELYADELSQLDFASNFWYFIVIDQATEDAKETWDSLHDEYDSLSSQIISADEKITSCEQEVKNAKQSLAKGKVEADALYDSRNLMKKYASESLKVALAYLDLDLADAQADYDQAVEKLDSFDSYIVDQELLSEYSGVVTDVSVSAGDEITTDDSLLSLYDWDDVTITATIDEEDISKTAIGDVANIALDAYPDTTFQGTVTEIADAVTNSSTGAVTYDVTVTINGDVSGLYEGMTGEVTFITREMKEVIYVSNRAILREGTKSYVKLYDENGKVIKREVTTGFSDGINVEIIEGLEEGEIVLIESKVSK